MSPKCCLCTCTTGSSAVALRRTCYTAASSPAPIERAQLSYRRMASKRITTPCAFKDTDAKDPEEVTKKFGLEAGIFSAFKGKNGTATAKDLLKRYGSAYLITSISLALVSFALCYVAVDSGVDVPSLLSRMGLAVSADSAWDKGGTLALAYAAHKALSPVRFPPTVALTPVVAQRLGKKVEEESPPSKGSEPEADEKGSSPPQP